MKCALNRHSDSGTLGKTEDYIAIDPHAVVD